jgi:alpha-glucosidase (family GH31 glycosyl hydrolase)
MVRPLVLEYPDDPETLREAVKYQFLCGESFLVAPVYQDEAVRDGIYLPAGTWIDYWTGERHHGPERLHGYPAPLDRLPLFVKAGSIIPMWPEGTLSWSTRDTGQLDLDVYPDADGTFTLYEDDGVTRAFAQGEYSEQTFTVTTSDRAVTLTIGATAGVYAGQSASRRYLIRLHRPDPPSAVTADTVDVSWHHAPDLGGTTVVQTAPVATGSAATITLRWDSPSL